MSNEESGSGIWTSISIAVFTGLSGALAAAGVAAVGLTTVAAIAPVGIALSIWAAAAHRWKTAQARSTAEYFRTLRRNIDRVQDQIRETQGLIQLSRVAIPFPLSFGGDYALTADAAAILAREILQRRPKVVLELGSGVSTMLVAKLLQDLGGGRIYSLDHDARWAAETRTQIEMAGLTEYAEVIDAPLRQQSIGGEHYSWYSLPDKISAMGEIEILIVDGPPQSLAPEGVPRYPALPLLLPYLSKTARIFLDDAKRAGEQETVRLWLQRYPGWEARQLPTVPGTCLLQRTSSEETRIPNRDAI